jgi:hypothetical protein
MMNIPYNNIVLFVCNKMTNSKHHTLNYIYIKFEDSKGIIRSHNPRRRDIQWPSGNRYRGVRVMVFNTTFNNISVISWWLVLLEEETGVPGENHRPAAVASH